MLRRSADGPVSFPFKVGSDTNSILGYRFDDKPGHDNVNVRFLQHYKTVVIEDRTAITRVVSELTGSNVLAMRIRSINAAPPPNSNSTARKRRSRPASTDAR